MSYNCSISFKKMEPIEIIPFLVSFKKECTKRLKEIADTEFGYCPFIRDSMIVEKDFVNIPRTRKDEAKCWAHNSIFKFKYFYNTELHLLGVFGVHKPLLHLFDGTVYFQNSTDQDYYRNSYKGISEFEVIYDKWMNMSHEDVKAKYLKTRSISFDEMMAYDYPDKTDNDNKIQERLNYYRRTFCYEEIWNHFVNHLYNDEGNIFFSVYGGYEIQEIHSFIKFCHDAQVRYEEEFEAEFGK